MRSVVSQSFDDYEYIVIDGGSTDGSCEVVRKYADRLTCWTSEKDTGIYNAMNKGIMMAKGDYLLFLHSGDCLINHEILGKIMLANHAEDILFGDIEYVDPDSGARKITQLPDQIDLYYLYRFSLWHQSSFINRELFKSVGLYNEGNKYVSDWEFFFNSILFHNATCRNVGHVVTRFDLYNGISFLMSEESRKEKSAILRRYLPGSTVELLQKAEGFEIQLENIHKSDAYMIYRWFRKHPVSSKVVARGYRTLRRFKIRQQREN